MFTNARLFTIDKFTNARFDCNRNSAYVLERVANILNIFAGLGTNGIGPTCNPFLV